MAIVRLNRSVDWTRIERWRCFVEAVYRLAKGAPPNLSREVEVSSFIDLLNKVGERAPGRMGFGASKLHDQGPPAIALIGRLTGDALAADPEIASADVDALLVDIGNPTVVLPKLRVF